jgi:putative ATP-dependent endonuclease of OLD family
MHLSRLYIENFRSIKNLNLRFSPGKNVIIGRNNAGKSNIIKAIDLVLGENSPDYYKYENITDEDFFTNSGSKANEIVIWCELTLEAGEKLDYPTLYQSAKGYQFYGENIRSPFRFSEEYIPNYLGQYNDEFLMETKKQWVDFKNPKGGLLEAQLAAQTIFAFGFTAVREVNKRIEKSLRLFYRENNQAAWILCVRAPFRTELLQSAFIPSFRDPQNQLRLNQWSWYGKLIRHLTGSCEDDPEMQSAICELNKVSDGIFAKITDKVFESSIATIFPETKLHFQFNTENNNDLFKSCVLYVDDGYKTQLTAKGSGIQSAVTIGLFSYYTQEVNTKGSALLCIEEPELYLHPHARRVISNNLTAFADGNKNQVILSTHSSEFINFPEDIQLILVRKNSCETYASSLKLKELQTFLLDNNQNEILFAEKIILCEGYDHYVVKLIAEQFFPGQLDNRNVSILAVEGKDNFKNILKYFLSLGLKCYILSDFDFLLRDKSEERLMYGEDIKPHESVRELGTNYFSQEYIFSESGDIFLSKLDKLRNKIKQIHPQLFYKSANFSDFHEKPEEDWIRQILFELRGHGICVLDGQIEDLIRPEHDVHGKLDRNELWKIKNKIESGVLPSELFYPDIIVEFISHVLGIETPIDYSEIPF